MPSFALRALTLLFALGASASALAAPDVATGSSSGWGSGGTVYGSARPGGLSTTGWFRFDTTKPFSCNDTFGTRMPSLGGASLGSGNTHVSYSGDMSGLVSGTTYYYCAIAENSSGKGYGQVHSFNFQNSAPQVTTSSATGVGSNSATLQGTGMPNGVTATAWFRYSSTNPGVCHDGFGTRTPFSGTSIGSGYSTAQLSQPLSGLSTGTTYWFCAIAQSAAGISFGSLRSFTTTAIPPTVSTSAATLVGTTSATLNGTANPKGSPTTGFFRYGTSNPGTCTTSFGTRFPASGGASLGSGNSDVPFSEALTGLVPATTYYFCAYADNAGGTAIGSVQSFATSASAPTITPTSLASNDGTTVTLTAVVNPHGLATSAWLLYGASDPGVCDDAFGTRSPAAGGFDAGSGTAAVPYEQVLTGLTPGATYYFCLVAENSLGKSFEKRSYTMPSPPSVTTGAASAVGSSSATISGLFNANGALATGWFVYGPNDPGTCNETFGTAITSFSLGNGTTEQTISRAIGGLTPGATYYYCAIAKNAVGTTLGQVQSFTAEAAAPAVVTSPASSVTGSSATLGATANPSGAATTGWLRYDTTHPGACSDTFGARVPSSGGHALGAGSAPVGYSEQLTGLQPGATYYFCAVAQNAKGTSFGALLSFVVPKAPTVLTSAATGVTPTSATLQGSANPNQAPTTAWFRYGTVDPGTCDDSFGSRLPATGGIAINAGSSAVPFSMPLSSPVPLTTYYFCAIAENAAGKSFGEVKSFTVPARPSVITHAASTVSSTSAKLSGTANPNGTETSAWFQYSSWQVSSCDDYFPYGVPYPSIPLGPGTAPVDFTHTLQNLIPGATYYYCALASSTHGRSNGGLQSFTMPPDAPKVTTSQVWNVNLDRVMLQGEATPHGAETTGWFRFSTTDPGNCNDTFGTRAPAAGGTALGAGINPQSWSQEVTGLPVKTVYYYCAIAQNSQGTSFGLVRSFTTPDAPVMSSSANAYPVGTTSATLRGSGIPRGDAATGWFRFSDTDPGACDDSFGTRVPATGGAALGSNFATQNYQFAISGLQMGRTYFFCAIGENSLGKGFSDVKSFTTMELPAVTTSAATNVTGTGATLHGVATPNGTTAYAWFRYGTTHPGTCDPYFGSRFPYYSSESLGSGRTPIAYSATLVNLTPGTAYYYCATAVNDAGQVVGSVESFTTLALPSATTGVATSVTSTSATLNGTVSPNGTATEAWFRYSSTKPSACNDTFGVRAPASGGIALGDGASPVGYSQPITGLTGGTTYWYCAIAQSSVGTRFGLLESFVAPAAPAVSTSSASAITSTSATLNGSANPRSTATTGWFRYDTVHPGTCSDGFGLRAPAAGGTDLGAGSSYASFSQPLTGLATGTTYYFCAIAENVGGVSFGAVQSFTAPGAPLVATDPASAISSTSFSLRGRANPRGASTTGYFRWGTTPVSACDDGYGTRFPSSGGTSLGSGNSEAAFSRTLSGLTAGQTYYFCAAAINSMGTTFGAVESFYTPAAPLVTTLAASDVLGTTLTLNASINPRGASTSVFFRYGEIAPSSCNDSFGTATATDTLAAGTDEVAYSKPITGLTPGRTYYFCAIAVNSSGPRFGSLLSVATPLPPAVTTSPIAALTGTSVTLKGSADPRGNAATGWFRFSSSAIATCDDSFGSRAPATGGSSLGAGSGAVAFEQALTGLVPGATYSYCAIAESLAGKSFGQVLTFTTPDAPTVSTGNVAVLSGSSAKLDGSAVPNRAAATGWFRYASTDPGACDDSFGARAPATGGTVLGAGTSAAAFTETVTTLQPGTTYFFCAIASNSEGKRFGALKSFTTPAAPTVGTLAATGIGPNGATLNGAGNPNRAAATGWFRYAPVDPGACADSFGTRLPVTGGVALGNGSNPVPFTQLASGLLPGTTYYFCAFASNAEGTTSGTVQSFTTPAAKPTVLTAAATELTGSSAKLNGSAAPNGDPATGWFRIGSTSPGACDDSFGTRIPSTGGVALGSGSVAVDYSQQAAGLTPGSTWYYCAIASNGQGTSFGALQSLTTAAPPTVTTAPADRISATAMTLNGKAIGNGAATAAWFRYATTRPAACDDSFGTRVPAQGIDVGADGTERPFSHALTGLTPGTSYHFCAIAENVAGISFGAVQTVRTLAAPAVLTGPATEVTDASARITGSANPNGANTVAWFRYSHMAPAKCTDSFGIRVPQSGGFQLGAGSNNVPFDQQLGDLQPGLTYYFCAIAQNQAGQSFGELVAFQPTALPPVVTTRPAVEVGTRTATLEAIALLNRSATTGWFRYDTVHPGTCNDTFGTRVPLEGLALGSFAAEAPYSIALEGLKPSTTYFFCAIASNLGGAGFGAVRELVTGDEPPTAQTLAAVVGDGAVVLNGAGTPNGLEAKATFRYGTVAAERCDGTFGQPLEPGQALDAGFEEVPFSAELGGLSAGQYYYCAEVSTAGGTTWGAVESFQITEAQIETGCGCGSGSGGAFTVWFGLMVLALAVRRRPGRSV